MDILDQIPSNEPNKNDNQLAMWAHLIGLASLLSSFLGLIGTIIFYFVNKDRHDFVRQHATQALNFQITYFLTGLIVLALTVGSFASSFMNFANEPTPPTELPKGLFATFGIVAIVGVGIWVCNLAICIIGATKANKGETWKNPIAIPFIR